MVEGIYRADVGNDTLRISADWDQSASSIYYERDRKWECTPFQVASARHDPTEAMRLVVEWLGRDYWLSPDEECEGSLECDECEGAGTLECDECEGAGTLECDECEGAGTLECPDCGGDGTVECDHDNGSCTELLAMGVILDSVEPEDDDD